MFTFIHLLFGVCVFKGIIISPPCVFVVMCVRVVQTEQSQRVRTDRNLPALGNFLPVCMYSCVCLSESMTSNVGSCIRLNQKRSKSKDNALT